MECPFCCADIDVSEIEITDSPLGAQLYMECGSCMTEFEATVIPADFDSINEQKEKEQCRIHWMYPVTLV